MRNKLIKLALMICALSVLPLVQGCGDGDEDNPLASTAWMPAYWVITAGGTYGLGMGGGTGTDNGAGAQAGAGVPTGTGGGNQVSVGVTQ